MSTTHVEVTAPDVITRPCDALDLDSLFGPDAPPGHEVQKHEKPAQSSQQIISLNYGISG